MTKTIAKPTEAPTSKDLPIASTKRRGVPWPLASLFWILILGLLGFDVWWIRRDSESLPSPAVVRGWISGRRVEEAKTVLRERLRRSPHDGEARMELARILGAEKDYLGCSQELADIPEWWPTKAEAAFLEGQSYKIVDRIKDAEAAWNLCNQYDPLHPTPPKYESAANLELMELYAYEERWDDAHRVIWNAYEHADPVDHPAILVMRIRTEMERIDPASAVVRLRRYVAADASDWEARLALARVESAIGRAEEANLLIRQCLEERPQEVRAWREWLGILLAQGDLPGLSEAIAKLPKGSENDAEIWKYRGLAAEKRQNWSIAAEAYRAALRLKPFEPEYHYKLSIAEERLGSRAAAEQHRKINKDLRAVRGQLTQAFEDYLKFEKQTSGSLDRTNSVARLVDLCEKLGWERVANGWRRLLIADKPRVVGTTPAVGR